MMLTDLADVARSAGLKVVEQPGWKTRGHGLMVDVRGVTCHHTANDGAAGDAPSLRVVQDGRPGLDGPLAHLVLGVSGTVYVVAAGLCYHAGVSNGADRTNSYRIGIEAEARGTGDPRDWPPAQQRAYAVLCAALARHYDFSIDQVLGHKETCSPTGRKSDPSFSMPAFRDRVSAVLVELNRPPREDDDMQLDDQVNLTENDRKTLGLEPGQNASVGLLLRRAALAQGKADDLAKQVAVLRADQQSQNGKLDQILAQLSK